MRVRCCWDEESERNIQIAGEWIVTGKEKRLWAQ